MGESEGSGAVMNPRQGGSVVPPSQGALVTPQQQATDVGQPITPMQPAKPSIPYTDFTEVQDEKKAEKKPETARGRKIGDGHLAAMARLGTKELAQSLQALPSSNITPHEEPGIYGSTPPPQQVGEQMGYSHQKALADAAKRGSNRADKDKGRTH